MPKGVSLEDNLITSLLFKEPDFPGIYGSISNIDFFGLIVIFSLHKFYCNIFSIVFNKILLVCSLYPWIT